MPDGKRIQNTLQRNWKAEKGPDYFYGIYGKNLFFKKVEEFLAKKEKRLGYCMAAVDIEHFKLFNEWFGFETGDEFLRQIAFILQDAALQKKGVAGYMGDDDFGILLPCKENGKCLEEIYARIADYMKSVDKSVGFFPSIGVYVLQEEKASASTMYDRASMAVSQVKGSYVNRIVYYQKSIQQEMEEELILARDIQKALERNEITYYLQPKCNVSTGKIVGAEALVRWERAGYGFVSPASFIPYLERNGLVGRLDTYVWDKVCRDIKNWQDKGRKAVPVSVNLSRVDIYIMDAVTTLKELVRQYGILPELLEVEITESAYTRDYEKIEEILIRLRECGFRVSMDDFGSGYSSLNMLKDINVDVLKIDMNFLNMKKDNFQRGVGIMESIMNMARLLGIPVVAEGVETARHVELLKDIGCRYAQGYLYYRPMPAEDFYTLIADGEIVDKAGIVSRSMDYVNISELVENNVLSQSMVDKILGAFAFYELHGRKGKEKAYRVKVNRSYSEMMEAQDIEVKIGRDCNIINAVHEDDRRKVLNMFRTAKDHPMKSARENFRLIKSGGEYIWVEVSLYYLQNLGQASFFCGKVQDITELTKTEEKLEISQKVLFEMLHLNDTDKDFQKLPEEARHKTMQLYSDILPVAMLGGYCEKDYPLFLVSSAIIKLLGYDSYEDFSSSIDRKVINTIYPEDRKKVMQDVGEGYYEGMEYTTTYRMIKKDNGLFWVLDRGRVIKTQDKRLAIISFCVDITEIMERQEDLKGQIKQLSSQKERLEYLSNTLPGAYHCCMDNETYQFLHISRRFLELTGYIESEIRDLFGAEFLQMVYPDDRPDVEKEVEKLRTGEEKIISLKYRLKTKEGYIWVVDQTCMADLGCKHFFHGTIIEVSKWKKSPQV